MEKVMKLQQEKGRWIYIFLGMLIYLCLGTVYSWSVFRKPLEEVYQIGATQSGLPYMLFLAAYSFLMPVGGILLEKYSPRTVITAGGSLMGMGWFLSGYAGNINVLSITYGIIAGGGVGIVYGVPITIVSRWFPDKKGLSVGLTLLGFGLSPFITAPIARWLIELYDPLVTFRILGIAFFLIISVLAMPLRYPKKPVIVKEKDKKTRYTDEVNTKKMLRTPAFYGLWVCFATGTLIGLMTIGMSSSVGEEIIKLDSNQAALAVSFFAVFNGLGRPLFGWLTDKLYPFRTTVIAYLLSMLSAALMLMANEGTIYLYVIAFSILWLTLGGWLAIAPTATGIFFGQSHYSKNYGFVFTAYGVGAVLGVLLSGMIRDMLGSYMYVFYPMFFLGLLGIVVSTLLLRNR